MPLPKPSKGQTEKDFIESCMGNSTMNKEFPDNGQRFKVCQSLFSKSKKASLPMKTRSFDLDFEIREDGEGEGIFEGHAAIFDKENSHGEIVQRGSFKDTLKSRGTKGVKMLFSHDRAMPIGKWTELREDSKGLFVRGQLLMQLDKAKEAFLLMREGILDGLSIGFRVLEDTFDREKEVLLLNKIDLREISLVLMPSAEDALVSKVRDASPEDITTKLELEKALRNAGFSRSTSQYIVAGWSPPARRNAEGGDEELVRTLRRMTETLKLTA